MASGTLASRITGQIRTILLAGALGVTGIAADAYQVGSQIPQVVFNLLAGGLLNAILVPQIVKAFKQHDYSSRINKLLTLSFIILFAFTALLMVATPILVNIYIDSGWTAPQKALANAFTLWCMPQVFFYGLYTVLGQVLAAKDRFGAYAWSSVAANIVSCAGFGAFILLFGNAQRQPLNFWTSDKIALSAGTWTLGVAVQALLLVVPLIKIGVKLHPEFGIHGIGLRSMGQVAIWTLGMVILDQLMGILNTRITTGAPVATGDRIGTAGSQAYMQAYTIWILPYSLITVSLATAIFPRLSRAIADRRVDHARSELSGALRTSGVIMVFFTAAFIAIPIPIIRSLLPSVGVGDASTMAIALIALSFGLLPSSVTLLLRRAFFAFEDGRSPFFLAVIQNLVQVVVLLTSVHFVDPHYWVGCVGGSLVLSNAVLMPISYLAIRRRMGGRIDGHRILGMYAKVAIGGVIATFGGLLLSPLIQKIVGASLSGPTPHMSWIQAIVVSAIVGLAMLGVYVVVLYVLRVSELTDFLGSLVARFTRKPPAPSAPSESSESSESSDEQIAESAKAPAKKRRTVGSAQALRTTAGTVKTPPTGRMAGDTTIGSVRHMIPAIGDTINNRYTLIALYRSEPGISAWLANDHTLVRDCQLFIISDSSKLAKVNAIASSLALSKDSHFTHVLHLQKQEGVSIIVTETDAGISLHEFLADPSHPVIGAEAMRTIAGTLAEAADTLRKVSLNHQAISTHTIRMTSSAITVADAPVSPLLTAPIKASSFNDSDEMLAVRQIAAVLYEMITGVSFDPNADPAQARAAFDAHRSEIPPEFVSICTRGLGIAADDGKTLVPIFTLGELLALLGSWSDPADLKKGELRLPSKQGAASIESATLAPVEPRTIVDIPDSLISADAVEEVPGPGDQQSPWSRNQLLFDGADAVEEIDSNSPNFLSAFESSFHNSLDQIDNLGGGLTGDFNATSQPTQALHVTDSSQRLNASESTATHDDFPVTGQLKGTPGNDSVPLPSESEVEAAQAENSAPHAEAPDAGVATAASNAAAPTTEKRPEQDRATSRSARSSRGTAGARQRKQEELQESQHLAALAMRKEGDFDADELENPDFVDENVGEVTSIIQPLPIGLEPMGGDEDSATSAQSAARRTTGRGRGTPGGKSAAGDEAEKTPKSVMGRNVALVVAAIALVVGLVWSIFHLGITPLTTDKSDVASSWNIDANNTPSPTGQDENENESSSNSDASTAPKSTTPKKKQQTETKKKATIDTADKIAKKVPDPAVQPVTNTNPYAIAATTVVRNVPGVAGIGVHLHLTQSQSVQRVRIISRTGGGKAAIYANSTEANPNNGSPLAEFTFKDNQQVTQVDLPQPVQTQDLVIWVSQQPASGFYYTAVRVY
jgi:putative peptidoglycan lipid II flippase